MFDCTWYLCCTRMFAVAWKNQWTTRCRRSDWCRYIIEALMILQRLYFGFILSRYHWYHHQRGGSWWGNGNRQPWWWWWWWRRKQPNWSVQLWTKRRSICFQTAEGRNLSGDIFGCDNMGGLRQNFGGWRDVFGRWRGWWNRWADLSKNKKQNQLVWSWAGVGDTDLIRGRMNQGLRIGTPHMNLCDDRKPPWNPKTDNEPSQWECSIHIFWRIWNRSQKHRCCIILRES